jgi:hypothetical protein
MLRALTTASMVSLHLALFDHLRAAGPIDPGERPGLLFCEVAADCRAAGADPAARDAFAFLVVGLHDGEPSADRLLEDIATVAPWFGEAVERWSGVLAPFRTRGEANLVDRDSRHPLREVDEDQAHAQPRLHVELVDPATELDHPDAACPAAGRQGHVDRHRVKATTSPRIAASTSGAERICSTTGSALGDAAVMSMQGRCRACGRGSRPRSRRCIAGSPKAAASGERRARACRCARRLRKTPRAR